jgi:regulator of sigma E protease
VNIPAAVGMIAILVFIHEFGHFIVAKACGVHVKVFSIGFGRRVVGVNFKGTEYRLSLLPFGGYVQMSGADPFGTGAEDDEGLDDPSQAFLRRPVWQRLLVVSAGPAFNLALPVVLFTVLLMAGEPQPANQLGTVERAGLAAAAGIEAGDVVTAIDGVETNTWNALARAISLWETGPHTVTVDRDGTHRRYDIAFDAEGKLGLGISHLRPEAVIGVDDPRSPAGAAGLVTGDRILSVGGTPVSDWIEIEAALAEVASSVVLVELSDGREVQVSRVGDWAPPDPALRQLATAKWGLSPTTLFVGSVGETVSKDSTDVLAGCRPKAARPEAPAYLAGLREGDRFLRLDGKLVRGWSGVIDGVRSTMDGDGESATARALRVELVRAGELVTLEITPTVIRDTNALGRYYYRPVLGVMRLGMLSDGPKTRVYYGFGDAFSRALDETTRLSGYVIEQIGKLLTGAAAVQKSLGGPVEMVRQASSAAAEGLFVWARLMGMLSISLGIINLLPVPVLDGGQFLFYAVEGLRGRPLSLAVRERAQQIGVIFLVLLMMSVLFFDLRRLFE